MTGWDVRDILVAIAVLLWGLAMFVRTAVLLFDVSEPTYRRAFWAVWLFLGWLLVFTAAQSVGT